MEALSSETKTRCSFHLLALKPSTTTSQLIPLLTTLPTPPFVVAKPLKWFIPPTKLAPHLLSTTWDLLIAFQHPEPSTDNSLSTLIDRIANTWSITANVPSPMVDNYAATTASLATAPPPSPTALTKPSTPHPELEFSITPELHAWAHARPHTPITMLNMLAYEPGKRDSYMGYIAGFYEAFVAKGVGAPKLSGLVEGAGKEGEEYEDVALVQYGDAKEFADRAESEEYAVLDGKWKVGAVRENALLCVEEVMIG